MKSDIVSIVLELQNSFWALQKCCFGVCPPIGEDGSPTVAVACHDGFCLLEVILFTSGPFQPH